MASRSALCIGILTAGSLPLVAAAQPSSSVTSYYTVPNPTPAKPVLTLPADGLGLVLRQTMPDRNEGLAGDPNAPIDRRVKLSPAEQDSYFNTLDYQSRDEPRGGKGHRSALSQMAGTAEAAAGNVAIGELSSLALGAADH